VWWSWQEGQKGTDRKKAVTAVKLKQAAMVQPPRIAPMAQPPHVALLRTGISRVAMIDGKCSEAITAQKGVTAMMRSLWYVFVQMSEL
jgi:hypothetical protein